METVKTRFSLEKYRHGKSRHVCPNCGKKEFTRYIDNETGGYIAPVVGRCERQNNCGYHFTPKQYFEQVGSLPMERRYTITRTEKQPAQYSFIDNATVKASLNNYEANNFVIFLLNKFGHTVTKEAIQRYFIGTSKHWAGSTVFWQIDKTGKARAGKIMLYNTETGKRQKDKINWVHSVLKLQNFNLRQCFFGEHLLNLHPEKLNVAVVESEKTAVIGSIYLPEYIWLATGSIQNLQPEKLKVLAGKRIHLFPDLKAGYDVWERKASEFKKERYNVHVNNFLKDRAGDDAIKAGYDIADYLLHFDLTTFKNKTTRASRQPDVLEATGVTDARLKAVIQFIINNPMPYPLPVNDTVLNTPAEVIHFFQMQVRQAISHQPQPENEFITTLETVKNWLVSNYFDANNIPVKE